MQTVTQYKSTLQFKENIPFKEKHSFRDRQNEATYMLNKHYDKIPVICEKAKKNTPDIKKNKFLVSRDITVGQFIFVIRKFIDVQPDTALFLFINDTIPSNSSFLTDIYASCKGSDGFLYVNYSTENTFG